MKLNSLPAIVLVALSATRSSAAPTPVDAKTERELSQSLKRQLSSTRNDLVSGACKALTVIFARGTTEAGNVGSIAGPPFFSALNSAIGAASVAVQGVDYPADVAGFLAGGDAAGSAKLAALVSQASTQCPSTKIVISGYRSVSLPTTTIFTDRKYSQGGQLVHNAAKTLSAALTAKISAGE